MSSQGPKVSGTVALPPFSAGFVETPSLAAGYPFTHASIRDGSDWIAYKKQQLISKETTAGINQTTWFKAGNNFRLQYLLGRYKCDSCVISTVSGVPSS
jgi:hypothetical protein